MSQAPSAADEILYIKHTARSQIYCFNALRLMMANPKVLVFGGTGPAGICLLRELLYRNHTTIAYARTPSKIPSELSSNPNLEIIQGEINDTEALSRAIAKCNVIISLLGPNTFSGWSDSLYPDFYRTIFPIMRQHGVSRIYAMSTTSLSQPQDQFALSRALMVWMIYLVANVAYRTMLGIGKVFAEEAQGLDWTVFRLGLIPGGCDEGSWRKDREGDVHAGWIGDGTWGASTNRSALAKWLVNSVESKDKTWIGKMPAVAGLPGGSGKKST